MTGRSGRDWITVAFITMIAAGIRLGVLARAGFPINDGGLFYTFVSDLLANGLRLPAFSTYNAAGIPFVYPPLAFYLTAILHLTTHVSVLRVLQFAPAAVSAGAIPVFFAFASRLTESQRQAVLATLVFALMPRSFDWLIMGGGITRSLGLFFFLVFLVQVCRLFAGNDTRALIPAMLGGTLVVLSHPEAAVHAALSAALLLIWHRRTRVGIMHGVALVLGVGLLTAPWWATVISRHGVWPWLAGLAAAQQDGHGVLLRLIALFRFDFTDEPFLRVFGVIGLLGLFVQVARREYFAASWLVLIAMIEPRGGTLFMMLPLAMSAGYFLDRVLLPALTLQRSLQTASAPAGTRAETNASFGFLTAMAPTLALGSLGLYGAFMSYFVGQQLVQRATLTRRDLVALQWLSDHAAPGDRFALVTGGDPLLDPTSDWFPAITERRSVASYFGSEWIRGLDFAVGLQRYQSLQDCANQGAECLREWLGSDGEHIDAIYVRAPDPLRRTVLQESLRQEQGFGLIYSANGIEIFSLRAPSG